MIRIFQKKTELRTRLVSTLGVDFTILEKDALKFSGEGVFLQFGEEKSGEN